MVTPWDCPESLQRLWAPVAANTDLSLPPPAGSAWDCYELLQVLTVGMPRLVDGQTDLLHLKEEREGCGEPW